MILRRNNCGYDLDVSLKKKKREIQTKEGEKTREEEKQWREEEEKR